MPPPLLHVLFFCSGLSGLIYQVVWVRQFGYVFGNTVQSASIVVAIFMLGLGAGGYAFGAFADRHRAQPATLVRLFAALEGLIALLGLLLAVVVPRLAPVVARLSRYETGADGWQVLTLASFSWRGAIAVLLLVPVTLLMGGTLTVLIRAFVHAGAGTSGWRVALLYGVNTIGAAAGALLTDFVLVPAAGLLAAQAAAISLNVAASAGALLLASRAPRPPRALARERAGPQAATGRGAVPWAALALACSGFAALGMEILWLRHLGVLLGGFRAVFSLLLTVMLLSLGGGAFAGGWLDRRFRRPAGTLMVVQALFAATALAGLSLADAAALSARGASMAATLAQQSPFSLAMSELWFNLRPMLGEVALPSFVGGMAFPLANGVVQHAEASVGRRAGALYLSNTAGAVCGSLATAYALLPYLGMQRTAWVLAAVSAFAVVPLCFVEARRSPGRGAWTPAAAGVTAVVSLVAWSLLPGDDLVRRSLGPRDASEHLLAVSEGATELVAIVERPGRGRALLTNGHAMSSTAVLDQRYMRALAHIPLLAMREPRDVLVIGFGVGNTAHAATMHPSVERVDVADLSPHVLGHASFFEQANRGVLRHPKVSVFVNDGRQHLQMAAGDAYDLITLEPPPIAHSGVGALYSREFYALARSRLRAGGYVSQWLPAYQVPAASSLSMVRAFVDVFPQSVLLSGTQAELLLLGTTAPRIELDAAHVEAVLARDAGVRQDLARVDLGSLREIAGTFVADVATLARATEAAPAATDDRPLQEYGVRSGLAAGLTGVPAALFDVSHVAAWCPGCASEGTPGARVPDLDLYLALLQQAYRAPVAGVAPHSGGTRRLLGSAYLGAVVPDSPEVRNLLGIAHVRGGRLDAAAAEFEEAIRRDPRADNARANLGQLRYDQGAALLEAGRHADAAALLTHAVDLLPAYAGAHNDLGVALASLGRVRAALPHFERAVALDPGFTEARRNLDAARQAAGP